MRLEASVTTGKPPLTPSGLVADAAPRRRAPKTRLPWGVALLEEILIVNKGYVMVVDGRLSPTSPSPLNYRNNRCVFKTCKLFIVTNARRHGINSASHLDRGPDRVDRSWTLGGRVPLRQRRAAILRAQCSAALSRRLAFWF